MVDIGKETNKRNLIETIVDSDEINWLNEKNVKDQVIKTWQPDKSYKKISSKYRKRSYEMVDESRLVKQATEYF